LIVDWGTLFDMLPRSCSHEGLRATFLHTLSCLIDDAPVPGYDTAPAAGVWAQCLDLGQSLDCIPEENRTMEFPFENGEKRECVDPRSLTRQTRSNRQTQQTMSYRPTKRVAFRGGMVNMEGVEISGQSGEQDNIRFGHSSSWALPLIADNKIIK
jgi:hypothetical protein